MFSQLINISNKLINGATDQPMYGVPVTSLYGVPRPRNSWETIAQFFLLFLFLILIPVILTIGVLVFAKKKQFPKKEKVWAVIIVLTIYFAILIGLVLTIAFFIR